MARLALGPDQIRYFTLVQFCKEARTDAIKFKFNELSVKYNFTLIVLLEYIYKCVRAFLQKKDKTMTTNKHKHFNILWT